MWPYFVSRDGFCEKLPEVSSMSGKANPGQLQGWMCYWPRLGQSEVVVMTVKTFEEEGKGYCADVIVAREERSENIREEQLCRHPG